MIEEIPVNGDDVQVKDPESLVAARHIPAGWRKLRPDENITTVDLSWHRYAQTFTPSNFVGRMAKTTILSIRKV